MTSVQNCGKLIWRQVKVEMTEGQKQETEESLFDLSSLMFAGSIQSPQGGVCRSRRIGGNRGRITKFTYLLLAGLKNKTQGGHSNQRATTQIFVMEEMEKIGAFRFH